MIDTETFKEILLHGWHLLPKAKQDELKTIGVSPRCDTACATTGRSSLKIFDFHTSNCHTQFEVITLFLKHDDLTTRRWTEKIYSILDGW